MKNSKSLDINGIFTSLKNNKVPDYIINKIPKENISGLLDLLEVALIVRKIEFESAISEFLTYSDYYLPSQRKSSLISLNIENHLLKSQKEFIQEQRQILIETIDHPSSTLVKAKKTNNPRRP